MTRTSRFPSHMVAPHNTPRHSRESDYLGLWAKKNYQRDLRAIMSRRLYFGLSQNMSHSN